MSRQYPLPLPHHVAMDADDYLVTPSNQMAKSWIDTWPAWPSPCLIIYGPSGCGKTHLAKVWQSRSRARLLSIDALAAQEPAQLAAEASAFLIEQAETIAGQTERETALFHLYNHLGETHGSLLLTARQPVAQWPVGLADLRSRLMAAPAAAIDAPDDQFITGLLIKQFHDRQLAVGMDVIDYLLPRMTRTPAAIRDLVERLDQASLSWQKAVTIMLAKQVMEGMKL